MIHQYIYHVCASNFYHGIYSFTKIIIRKIMNIHEQTVYRNLK